MSKEAKRWRKLYKRVALGKVDVDLDRMITKYKRLRRWARVKTTAIFVLAAANVVTLLAVFGVI